MTDFARARINMVNGQLATNGISDPRLIEAYQTLPREVLVSDACKARVYCDEDIPIKGGCCVLEPLVEARLLQAAMVEPIDCSLILGVDSLPTIAMLASFSTTVIAVDRDAQKTVHAQDALAALEICNVVTVNGPFTQGYQPQAPYDVIFVPGAITEVPKSLSDQLAVGGRFICIIREAPNAPGRASVFKKNDNGTLDVQLISNVSTPYLPGFKPGKEFTF